MKFVFRGTKLAKFTKFNENPSVGSKPYYGFCTQTLDMIPLDYMPFQSTVYQIMHSCEFRFYSPASSAEVKNKWHYNSTSVYAFRVFTRNIFFMLTGFTCAIINNYHTAFSWKACLSGKYRTDVCNVAIL